MLTSTSNATCEQTAQGEYTHADIPVGAFIIEAYEPTTNITSAAPVSIAQDQTTTQNLTLIGLGQAQVQVNFASGSPAQNAQVYIIDNARGYSRFVGYTDAGGRLTTNNVPVGAFTMRAYHPNNTSLYTDVNANLPAHGDTVSVTIALPATGVVTGRVTFADGRAVNGSYVEIYGSNFPGRGVYTDSNGNYSVTQVPVGRVFSVRAYDPNFNISREVPNNTLATDGETLNVNVTLPGKATVRVTVLRSDGTPYQGARIDIRDSYYRYFRYVGITGADGRLNIADVPEGDFALRAYDISTYASAGSASGTVTLADNNGSLKSRSTRRAPATSRVASQRVTEPPPCAGLTLKFTM
jgi:hypothetical protein